MRKLQLQANQKIVRATKVRRVDLRLSGEMANQIRRVAVKYPDLSRDDLICELIDLGLPHIQLPPRTIEPTCAAIHHIGGRQPNYLPTWSFADFHHLWFRHHLSREHAGVHKDTAPSIDCTLSDE
jgi:hypothetical protein